MLAFKITARCRTQISEGLNNFKAQIKSTKICIILIIIYWSETLKFTKLLIQQSVQKYN